MITNFHDAGNNTYQANTLFGDNWWSFRLYGTTGHDLVLISANNTTRNNLVKCKCGVKIADGSIKKIEFFTGDVRYHVVDKSIYDFWKIQPKGEYDEVDV